MTAMRKKKGLSQADLGKAIGTSGDMIGIYERDEVKPSIEVAVKIADALDISLDYLVGKTKMELDADALRRLEDIAALSDENKSLYSI